MSRKIGELLTLVAWFGGLLLVGGVVWVAVLSPGSFRLSLVVDPGFLFVVAIVLLLFLSTYAVVSRFADSNDR